MKKNLIILFLLGICQIAFSQVCGNVGIIGGASLSQNQAGGTCGVFASAEIKWLRFEAEFGWSQLDFKPSQNGTPLSNIFYINPSIGMVVGDECRIVMLLGVTNWGGLNKENQLSKRLICPKIKIGGEIPIYPFMYLNISWNGIIAPSSSIAIYTNNFLTVSVGYRF
jgi:hypothetical protein